MTFGSGGAALQLLGPTKERSTILLWDVEKQTAVAEFAVPAGMKPEAEALALTASGSHVAARDAARDRIIDWLFVAAPRVAAMGTNSTSSLSFNQSTAFFTMGATCPSGEVDDTLTSGTKGLGIDVVGVCRHPGFFDGDDHAIAASEFTVTNGATCNGSYRWTQAHDSGNPRDQTLTFFEAITPRGYLGWGKSTQLGTGYGVALGAKLAHPDKLVVNIMGDLAFGTAGMEVETAVRERIPIMTVLLNNSVMGGYGHHMPNASERFGSNRLSGNYWKVAEGLGAYAERIDGPGDVAAAIRRGVDATKSGRPVVLEMITKEEPIYPTAPALIAAVAKELQPA